MTGEGKPAYKNGAFDLTELARLWFVNRTTAYKYIGLLENKRGKIVFPACLFFNNCHIKYRINDLPTVLRTLTININLAQNQ